MKIFSCPFCGPRPQHEFRFRTTVPARGSSGVAAVYLRDNDAKSSHEYWQHEMGCRSWLLVHRNPSTSDVLDIRVLGKVSS